MSPFIPAFFLSRTGCEESRKEIALGLVARYFKTVSRGFTALSGTSIVPTLSETLSNEKAYHWE